MANKKLTVLVICEAAFWHDFKTGLAAVGVDFLGFDKKKPNRDEIDNLVAKSDLLIIKNKNVAHHSVKFAKQAAKATGKPFWIGGNFGVEKMVSKLQLFFPEQKFEINKAILTTIQKSPHSQNQSETPSKSILKAEDANQQEVKKKTGKKRKNLALKPGLKDFKMDDENDFVKRFGK